MKLDQVNDKHGAPMGRPSHAKDTGDHDILTCHLLRVELDRGGYDSGGAYWGLPSDLWRVFNAEVDDYAEGELVDTFLRSPDRDQAEARAIITIPFPIVIQPYTGDLDLDEFLDGYVTAALWSSTYEKVEGEGSTVPMDDDFGPDDIDEESMKKMKRECEDFVGANHALILDYLNAGRSMPHAGHDFWLTRNGHGAGFWDRGLGELGDKLTVASKTHGSSDLYVGDDGKVHIL